MSGYNPYYSGGWQSGESGGTPITPAALNNMESGIGAALTAADVVNNLTSTATDKPLSANMGKELNGKATKKMSVSGTTTSSGALLVNIPSGGIVVAINVTSEFDKIALKRSGAYIHIYTPTVNGLEPYANADVSADIYYQIIE